MDNTVLSHLLLADECLLDVKRVKMFERAIKKAVTPNSIVVDAGTGTGIMALFAAKAGAKKVYALEINPEIAEMTRKTIQKLGFGKVVTVVNCNVQDYCLPDNESADVLIMELLDTGLIAEHQAIATIALKKNGVIREDTILIPGRVVSAVRPVDYNFNFYGFEMPITIQARNFRAAHNIQSSFAAPVVYSDLDLKNIKTPHINTKVEIPINREGTVNAIELETHTYLLERRSGATTDMNMPVIVPIEPLIVKKGDIIKVNIKYEMSKGFNLFSIDTHK